MYAVLGRTNLLMCMLLMACLSLFLSACTYRVSQSPLSSPTPRFNLDRLGTVERGVTYCVLEGVSLKMDVYYPSSPGGPWSAIIYIHGGGWFEGDKGDAVGLQDIPALVARQFLVVAVNYRLAPDYTFPAMLHDVRCAVRHLRAEASRYNLDPQWVGAYGESAGGQLASLLGLMSAEEGYHVVGPYADFSSRVNAVVDMFGPVDLTDLPLWPLDLEEVIFGGEGSGPAQLKAASPIQYITPDDPPFLIIHGDRDPLVPLEQSIRFHHRLQEAGVDAELVIVENAGHSFFPMTGELNPSRMDITDRVVDFFTQLQP